jgi:hypothetical protein
MRKPNLRLRFILSTLFIMAAGTGCGKFEVDHHVDGTVTVPVQVNLNPQMFIPFFLQDCQSRVAGDQCYSSDPTKCASCMANSIFSYLTTVSPTPSPSQKPSQ